MVVPGHALPYTVQHTTAGATLEEEELPAGPGAGASVWFVLEADVDCTVRVATTPAATEFDTLLAVYAVQGWGLDALRVIVRNDDCGDGERTSCLLFAATAGAQYAVQVDGYNGASGPYGLLLAAAAAPPPFNDPYEGRAVLGDSGAVGTTVAATRQGDDPDLGVGVPTPASVWYTYTAARTGPLTLTTAGSEFDTVLGVFPGGVATLGALGAPLAVNDDCPGANAVSSCVTVAVTRGTQYVVVVAGWNGQVGGLVLTPH